MVCLVFYGDVEWSFGVNYVFGLMVNIFCICLCEVLCEDMGGVYGVGVGGNILIWLVQCYNVSIFFGCDFECVDELIVVVCGEIECFQIEGFDQDDIDKICEIQCCGCEMVVEQNCFWVSVFESVVVNEQDLFNILKYDEFVDMVIVEFVQEVVKKYMQCECFVLGVLLLEEVEESVLVEG